MSDKLLRYDNRFFQIENKEVIPNMYSSVSYAIHRICNGFSSILMTTEN